MDFYLAIILPSALLLLVVLGYLATVFEPYYAVNTEEGRELLRYHSNDPKLQKISLFWTIRLMGLPEGSFSLSSNKAASKFYDQVHYLLVHHRFIFGDDPKIMRFGGNKIHRLLRIAINLTKIQPVVPVEEIGLTIGPCEVKSFAGEVVWKGYPQEYKSRFNDMYYEP